MNDRSVYCWFSRWWSQQPAKLPVAVFRLPVNRNALLVVDTGRLTSIERFKVERYSTVSLDVFRFRPTHYIQRNTQDYCKWCGRAGQCDTKVIKDNMRTITVTLDRLLLTLIGVLLLLGRVALVRCVAGYSHQTFPWTSYQSVGLSVGLSSALRKNVRSDLDALWHRRSDGPRDKAGGGV